MVAQLNLDGGCLYGGLGMSSWLHILRRDDAHGLGNQLLSCPLGWTLLFCRRLWFQPGLQQFGWMRTAGQFFLPGQQGGTLQWPQLVGYHFRRLPETVSWVDAGWGDLAFEGRRDWGAVGATDRRGAQCWRLELV